MIYTILISVVFLAELIIVMTILQNLHKLDKKVLELDETLTAIKPSVKDIGELSRKISEQWKIIAQEAEDMFLKYLSKALIGALVLNLNFKFVKKIRNAKLTKTLAKGWSLIESMV